MNARELTEQSPALPGAVEEFPFGGEVSVFKVGGNRYLPQARAGNGYARADFTTGYDTRTVICPQGRRILVTMHPARQGHHRRHLLPGRLRPLPCPAPVHQRQTPAAVPAAPRPGRCPGRRRASHLARLELSLAHDPELTTRITSSVKAASNSLGPPVARSTGRTPARDHRAGRGSGRRPGARERRGGADRCGPGSPEYGCSMRRARSFHHVE
jgi:hypothetical protein